MRKILLLFCILSVTVSARAQLFGKHWEKGYYITATGQKVEGLISWSPPSKNLFRGDGDVIFYKADKDADKKKIGTDSLERFVMGNDNFVISSYADLSRYPVLKVMLNTKISLYQSMTVSQSGGGMMPTGAGGAMMMTPMFSMDNSKIYYGASPNVLTELKRKDFIEVMSKIMADNQQAVDAVKNKTFRYGDLPELITFYNRGPNWGHPAASADSIKQLKNRDY